MPFYREAVEEDFTFERTNLVIPAEVRKVLEEKKNMSSEALVLFRDLTGVPFHQGQEICKQYLAILHAYEDFKNGVKVYTDYNYHSSITKLKAKSNV